MEKSTTTTINERFEMLVRMAGVRDAEFCRATGISKSVFSNIIRDVYSPNLDSIVAVAETFPYLSLRWLIMGQGDPSKESPHQLMGMLHKSVKDSASKKK